MYRRYITLVWMSWLNYTTPTTYYSDTTNKQTVLASWFYWICLMTNKGKQFFYNILSRSSSYFVGWWNAVYKHSYIFSIQHLVFSFHTAQRNFHVETKCSLFFNIFVLQVAVNRILFPCLSYFEKEWKNQKTTIITTRKRDTIRYATIWVDLCVIQTFIYAIIIEYYGNLVMHVATTKKNITLTHNCLTVGCCSALQFPFFVFPFQMKQIRNDKMIFSFNLA